MRSKRIHRVFFLFLFISWCFWPPYTADGELRTAGLNRVGNLGRNETKDDFIFAPVKNIPRVSMVACGSRNVIAVTEDNSVSIVFIKANLTHWGWDNMATNFLTTLKKKPFDIYSRSDQDIGSTRNYCCVSILRMEYIYIYIYIYIYMYLLLSLSRITTAPSLCRCDFFHNGVH